MAEKEQRTYVPEYFISGFRSHPHGLDATIGDLDVPELALALLDIASRAGPPGVIVTLRATIRKFIDPNITGGQNYISRSEVAALIEELLVGEKHVGALATLAEFGHLGYTRDEINEIRKEFARKDRIDSSHLCTLFGCWPPQRRPG